MNESASAPPGWFRLLAWLGVLWNAIGAAMYLHKVGLFGDPLAGLAPAERTLAESVPGWVTGAFAIAVFAGLLGALALALAKRIARPLLSLSLLAVLAQSGWIVLMSDARAVHGLTGIAMPALIALIALMLVWLADKGVRRGWVN